MKKYTKPIIRNVYAEKNIVPAAMVAAGLSVGGAFSVGVASGLMAKNFPSSALNSVQNKE